jgi:hypothetical protein
MVTQLNKSSYMVTTVDGKKGTWLQQFGKHGPDVYIWFSIETTGATICGRGVIYMPRGQGTNLLKLSTGQKLDVLSL